MVEPDFQQRGAHDYREDACLTLSDFEKIILNCVLYYNSKRLMDSFPMSREMLKAGIRPYASEIWNYGRTLPGANLIAVTSEQIKLTLLPRATAALTRKGLVFNKLRYYADGFTDRYLQGESVTVAYDSADVSQVWLVEKGMFTAFSLIEARYAGMSFDDAEKLRVRRSAINQSESEDCLRSQLALAEHIEAIADRARHNNVSMKTKAVQKKRRNGGGK